MRRDPADLAYDGGDFVSLRSFKIGIAVAGGVVVAFAIALTAVALRGEDTRNIIEKSACTKDPSSVECQSIRREADRERSVKDSCIPFRQVLTRDAYRELTRCPRREVVPQTSETAGQSSGPGEGPSTGSHVPDEPNGTPVTDKPSGPRSPSKPSPPSEPSKPSGPTQPTSPAPKPVQVTAPGVNLQVGDGGICAGAAGIRLDLGNC